MAEFYHINVTILKDNKLKLEKEKENFANNAYSDFKNSYYFQDNNSVVRSMRNELEPYYNNIKKGYNSSYKWLNEYISNLECMENYLAEKGGLWEITDADLLGVLRSKLEPLKKYKERQTIFYKKTGEGALKNNVSFNSVAMSSKSGSDVFSNFAVQSSIASSSQLITKNMGQSYFVTTAKDKPKSWFEKAYDKNIKDSFNTMVVNLEKANDATKTFMTKGRNTTIVAAAGLVEGVATFGEALVDVAAIGVSAVNTTGSLVSDSATYLVNKAFNTNFEYKTGKMWEDTMSFVSKKHVKTAADFVHNLEFSKKITSNSYFYDQTRAISSGIGYIAGVTVLTVCTAGIGTAAVGASAGGTATATGVSAINYATTAGIAGFGRGTEQAWSEGADLGKGLAFGAATGVYDGIQYFVGSKINSLNIIPKGMTSNQLTKTVVNGLSRAALDGVDGGSYGFVAPLLSLIYKDGYTNDKGVFIKFTNEKFSTKYKETFDDNGGMTAVATGAAMGLGFSMLSESFSLKNMFKNITTETPLKISKAIRGESLELTNLGTISGNGQILHRFEYKLGKNKPLVLYSEKNILKEIDNLPLEDYMKITAYFLSNFRVSNSELGGYIGSFNIVDGNIKITENHRARALINKNPIKSIDRMNDLSRINYRLVQIEKSANKGMFRYIVESDGLIKTINSKHDLIDLHGKFGVEFNDFFERKYISNIENIKNNDVIDFSIKKTNTNGVPLIFTNKEFENQVVINNQPIDENTVFKLKQKKENSWTLIYKNSEIDIEKIDSIEIDGKKYYTYELEEYIDDTQISQYSFFSEMDVTELMSNYHNPQTKKELFEFFNPERINQIKRTNNDVNYLGRIFKTSGGKTILLNEIKSLNDLRMTKIIEKIGSKTIKVRVDENFQSNKQKDVDIYNAFQTIISVKRYHEALELANFKYTENNELSLIANSLINLLQNINKNKIGMTKTEIDRANNLIAVHHKKYSEMQSMKKNEYSRLNSIKTNMNYSTVAPNIKILESIDEISKHKQIDRVSIDNQLVKLHPKLLENIKVIEVYGVEAPSSIYWKYAFGNQNHTAAASASRGTISFWSPATEVHHSTLVHEAAHLLDSKKNQNEISQSEMWKKAMEKDYKFSKKESCTEYGKSNNAEDFAESVAHFFIQPKEFNKNFPERTKMLKKLFEIKDKPTKFKAFNRALIILKKAFKIEEGKNGKINLWNRI